MVEVGMGKQHPIYPFKLAIQGIIPKPLPESGRLQVFSIKSFQRWQQSHGHGVEQPCAGSWFKVLLIELLVSFIGEAEIQKQPAIPVLQKYLVPASLVDTAIESQPYHTFPP